MELPHRREPRQAPLAGGGPALRMLVHGAGWCRLAYRIRIAVTSVSVETTRVAVTLGDQGFSWGGQ
jgi:hypothetical protein